MRSLTTAVLLLCACASVRHSNTYIVQVATYWQPQQASRLRDDLSDHGYAAFVEERMVAMRSSRPLAIIVANDRGETYPTNMRYLVRVGPYDNSGEAERARLALRTAGFRPYVVHH